MRHYFSHFFFPRRGFAALTLVLLVAVIAPLVVAATVFTVKRQIVQEQTVLEAGQALAVAEGGVEEVALRISRGETVASPLALTVGGGTATVTNSVAGSIVTVTAVGTFGNAQKAIEIQLEKNTTDVQFFYGVQVDDGGVDMENGSSVIGNVYSNGNITGDSGATISGTATVAGGLSGAPQVQWATQNSDYFFGLGIGTVLVTIDSGGDVGQYTSSALGSDGFARISYYDVTNKDLKFVRCTDADCTAKNITTVDSSGDQGFRYTGIDLGSDTFARISYYDNTGHDLKFVRCTDADCTAKNITTVESTNDIGQFSSMKLGSDGFGRISYYSVSAGDLKFVQCTNADCSSKNITTVDSTNDTGKYTSLAIAADGFARISYINETSDDLKFVQCTNAACSTSVITTVDSAANVNQNTALTLGSDGFARISYYDDGNDDLKFVQCTNASCSSKNIATLDSGGDVGRYSSVQLGSDQFARITYYDANNGDLKFIQCTNAACTTKNTAVPDPNNVGQYTSLLIGPDGFGRASYYDVGVHDLKFVKCSDAACSPPTNRIDAAQSFTATATGAVPQMSVYLAKVGSPSADITMRLTTDNAGKPATSSLASATLSASSVGTNASWINVAFGSPGNVTNGTKYWLVLDYTTTDPANYWNWRMDNTDAYANNTGKSTDNWSSGSAVWANAGGDLAFRVWIGGSVTQISNVTIGNATSGDGYANQFVSTTIHGSVCPNAYCHVENPTRGVLPISDGIVQDWKDAGAAGGQIVGDYNVTSNVSLGPKEITGNLVMTSNNKTLTVTGTIYVHGHIDISNGSTIRCDTSYGQFSCVVLADDWIHLANNGEFSGSGQAGSYVMLLSTLACTGTASPSCTGHHNGAVDLHNNANGAIFYAAKGMIHFHNNVNAQEVTAWKLELDNNAVVTYDSGLVNAQFSSGPGGGYAIRSWREILPP